MRSVSLLPLAVLAGAIVLPDPTVFEVFRQDNEPHQPSLKETVTNGVDYLNSAIHKGLKSAETLYEETYESLFESEMTEDDEFSSFDHHGRRPPPHHEPGPPHRGGPPREPGPPHGPGKGRGGHPPHHHKPNHTIYQLISKSNYTTKFAKLVDEFPEAVAFLNSTSHNLTLFAPVDSAFEHVPKDKKPKKEFLENLLAYHVGLGLYPAGRVLFTHTIPSAYNETGLGGAPQRLRTSVGILSGVRVNFYSKVVAVDIFASNGVIHGVNKLLVPPPNVGDVISLLPSQFSTLTLAGQITGFPDFISSLVFNGSTVFAPSNRAFAGLGPRANAFLFNTEKGKGYLKALLKYHVVANETLYSDAYYSNTGAADADNNSVDDLVERDNVGGGHFHVDFPTLLDEKPVAIDVARWGGFIRIKVNGYVPVVVQDGIASDGVIHVVGKVLIPPHKHRSLESEVKTLSEEISVEDLMERLEDYVDEEDEEVELEL